MKNLVLILICVSSFSYGQIANRWQPDSIYSNRNVKKILVYLNSPEDISEIVEFDKDGKKIRVEKYSASYDEKSRKTKKINIISHYKYQSNNKLIEITDSLILFGKLSSINRTLFEYDSESRLRLKKHLKHNYNDNHRITKYSYSPFETNLIIRNDSTITLNKIQEYDKKFYVSRDYGFYLQPKVKQKKIIINGQEYDEQYEFLERYDANLYFNNEFDKKGNLKSSNLKALVSNKWKKVYKLNYQYYQNGLLESITGYVPRYFKYEYWE